MPYLTFSRNFKDKTAAKRLLKSLRAKDTIVELRGTKTIKKVAEIAASKGFRRCIVIDGIDEKSGSAVGLEMRLKLSANGTTYKYGNRKAVKI